MTSAPSVAIITPTWAGDLEHFRLMRCSIEQSPLAALPHYVVVQDEDLPLFEEFRSRQGLTLLSTKEVLPEAVELRRAGARMLADRFGRNVTRICGSLKRVLGWPKWPSYTGWHTQQLCKLKLASELPFETAVVLDSDVVVTRSAAITDFIAPAATVCFAEWEARQVLKGKVRNWVTESEALVGAGQIEDRANIYFDTPFVFDRNILSQALKHLEGAGSKPWWQVLLDRPPRRWSEFGYYKAFLMYHAGDNQIEWREPDFFRYVYDTSSPEAVVSEVTAMLDEHEVHYITIHSQASGREDWDAAAYLNPLALVIGSDR
ncbi:MAG: DUF6492 family protein [Alteromonadaceae bacterium]|uniref:DUF6492 family protein n=1 Tax=Marinobacter sp. TaxID=50741 RepID=UPI0029C19D3E|nr:DUF6492 family protein [Marinobacter sp.]MDX5385998.1 DUF6492 family protein [Marinobacter sp.]MDX5441446.1 DUF6492 family protein [Alteromonadaceae bacterium]